MTGFVGTLTDYALMDEGEFIGKYAARIDDKPYVVMPHVTDFLMRLQKGSRVDVVLNKDGWISKISRSKAAPADDLNAKMQKNGFAVPTPATQPKEVPPERAPDELFTDAEVAAMKAKTAAQAPVVDGIAAIVAATKANAERLQGETSSCTSPVPLQTFKPVPMEPVKFSADQINLIKSTVAKNCTNTEFELLMYLAAQYQLDPIRRQIWAVKYGTAPASIFTGRDGFLEIAHRSGVLDGMESGVKSTEDGKDLIGWCRVYRKDMAHPFYVEVYASEYNTHKSVWNEKPRVMIQKVAESSCLRRAFSVSGLYCPEEMPDNGGA